MRTVDIYRAQPTNGHGGEETVIRITEEIPPMGPGPNVLADVQAIYATQGKRLAEALGASLPGGTFDVLLGELRAMRASLFRVGFDFGEVVEVRVEEVGDGR